MCARFNSHFYRLSTIKYGERFVLKGAMLMTTWFDHEFPADPSDIRWPSGRLLTICVMSMHPGKFLTGIDSATTALSPTRNGAIESPADGIKDGDR